MTAISQCEIAPLLQFGGCEPNLSATLDRLGSHSYLCIAYAQNVIQITFRQQAFPSRLMRVFPLDPWEMP
jgi:hypothetical protein